ncbi:uncharacterized protein N0V89_009237 [Didymosphaeria variabile]|uniref:Uncharacterized protein n=1 Tax=Didymosphaeria variabile TaxID=1932322 RepID=A0A9W8XDF0_9PLEO|nr:uncharacterized protein N0V89_009237 [Didymosphaeria variabile]KAJ4347867.1 hypothetical protein N0V89_009237 [Didymosphaeria variabile]
MSPGTFEIKKYDKQSLDRQISSDDDLADPERAAEWFTQLVDDERLPDQFDFALKMEYWIVLNPGRSFGFHNDTDEIEMLCVRACVPEPDGITEDEKRGKVVFEASGSGVGEMGKVEVFLEVP